VSGSSFTLKDGVSEGQSWDGKVVVLVASDKRSVRIVNMNGGQASWTVGPVKDVYEGNACGSPSLCEVDWATVSPTGQYLVISFNGDDYIRVYSINQSTFALTPMVYDATASYCGNDYAHGWIFNLGHGNTGPDPYTGTDDSRIGGTPDIAVGQNQCSRKSSGKPAGGWPGETGHTLTVNNDVGTGGVFGNVASSVMAVRLDTGHAWPVSPWFTGGSSGNAFANTASMLSYDVPGWVLVTFSNDRPGKIFNDEIVGFPLHYGQPRPFHGVIRYGRGRSDQNQPTGGPSGDYYRSETHAVPSPGGRRIAFASTWTLLGVTPHTCQNATNNGTVCTSSAVCTGTGAACLAGGTGAGTYFNTQDYVIAPFVCGEGDSGLCNGDANPLFLYVQPGKSQ
jgi:hypothetical protein